MINHRSRRTRAGGAVVAVMVAATACGIPTASTPTAIGKDNVPIHLLNPTTPSTSTSTIPLAVGVSEQIFMVAPTQHLVAVSRVVALPATMTEILGALLEGPTASETSSGYQSFLTGTRTQVSATVTGGIATVNFTANPAQLVGPNQILAIAQVVFTATAQPGVTGVLFEIAGQAVAVPTSGGAQVLGPVNPFYYLTQAPA